MPCVLCRIKKFNVIEVYDLAFLRFDIDENELKYTNEFYGRALVF